MTLYLPIVIDVDTFDGDDPEYPMANIPWADAFELSTSDFLESFSADAIVVTTAMPRVEGKVIEKYRGACIKNTEFDGSIYDCICRQSYVGAVLPSSDTEISRCRLYDNRDVNLWIAAGVGSSNCQSLNNHTYGAQISVYNEGSGVFRSLNDTYADSYMGFLGDTKVNGSHQAAITNAYFQHNTIRDSVSLATSNHFVNCIFNISKDTVERNTLVIDNVISVSTEPYIEGKRKVGIELAERCSIRAGVVELIDWIHGAHTASGNPVECIWVNAGLVVIDTLIVEWQGIDGAVAIRVTGACESLKVDVTTLGFHQTNSKVLILNTPAACKGLDITFRVTGNVAAKSLATYFNIGTGWTGRILFWDTYNNVKLEYVDGVAQ